jgi:hypothetical protein
MVVVDIKQTLLEIAKDAVNEGPGYAQEAVVLRRAAEVLHTATLMEQQELLTHWHELFRGGELAWGYDLDNPNAPFFHLGDRGVVRDEKAGHR